MATASPARRSARFDQFEVDFAAVELRKSGRRVPLQDQPFQILRLLIESAPEVVPRDKINAALWPSDTFVDFELAVNTAVRKLRQALGDSIDQPKYIQTVPKQGYRFLTSIEWVNEEGSHEKNSIVVLPFEDLSPDHSEQYFCEGMAAEIISILGKFEGLRVISRTSAVRCFERKMDVREIGRYLNVSTILEGTVRRFGSRLRVTVQLITSGNAAQIWSDRYERNEGDVFDIQEEIANAIVKNLYLSLLHTTSMIEGGTATLQGSGEQAEGDAFKKIGAPKALGAPLAGGLLAIARWATNRIRRRSTRGEVSEGQRIETVSARRRAPKDIEAYNLYLKGRYFWERRNRVALENAFDCFEQAISADPEYALPHAGLANCYTIMGIYSIKPISEVHTHAFALAKRALELDPVLPEAYESLGAVKHFLEWDWLEANSCYQRALEMDRRLAVGRAWRATLLVACMDQKQDGIAESDQALRLEPDSGLVAYIASINHYWAGDLDRASELIERAITLEPRAVFAHWLRSQIFCAKELHEEAILSTMSAVTLTGRNPLLISALGSAYGRAGRIYDAELLIEELKIRSAREYIASQYIGEIYLALGCTATACDWFEHAVDERNPLLTGLAVAPRYRDLRNEPRFQLLLNRMNLPARGLA